MQTPYSPLIGRGAMIGLIGYIASGPIGFILVRFTKPQPSWTSPAEFASNYHVAQDIPFYFGFLLLGGMLALSSAYYLDAGSVDPARKFKLLIGLVSTIVFLALISFNYICQTTFVRHLALNYRSEYDAAIATFSMTNPLSFCWANEIWGYGFLGVATWFSSVYYSGRNNLIRNLMVANGVVSVATVFLVIADTNWLLMPIGITAYFTWNILMIVMMVMIYVDSRK